MNAAALEVRLGWSFRDPGLLRRALTHRSYAVEAGGPDNERLEYLGDAVLQLVVTERLLSAFPEAAEGHLTRVRAAIVRTEGLARVARAWGLGDHLLLGRGEAGSGGRDRDSVLADAVEAVLGALYLEGGLPACRQALAGPLEAVLAEVADPAEYGIDPKTRLQEMVQRRWHRLPRYDLVGVEGPDHERRYRVEVVLPGGARYPGEGTSRRRAERAAARAALEAGEEAWVAGGGAEG